ncbi:hypothetical protein HSE3_gp119 [Bacillus phage vB_BceM-HSE3]|nr:hypothetical protein HSE3_gp119 [Bacillus phage vB_BceM-HSE3]
MMVRVYKVRMVGSSVTMITNNKQYLLDEVEMILKHHEYSPSDIKKYLKALDDYVDITPIGYQSYRSVYIISIDEVPLSYLKEVSVDESLPIRIFPFC